MSYKKPANQGFEDTVQECNIDNYESNEGEGNTIAPIISSMSFSDAIKREAEKLYIEYGITMYRAGRLKMIIYLCLFDAHRNLGVTCNPQQLKKEVGIKESTVMTSIYSLTSKSSASKKGGINPTHLSMMTRQQTPYDFINHFYRAARLSEKDRDRVVDLCNKVTAIDESIIETSKPQLIAAALILAYLEKANISDAPDFSTLIGCNKTSIESMKRRVSCLSDM